MMNHNRGYFKRRPWSPSIMAVRTVLGYMNILKLYFCKEKCLQSIAKEFDFTPVRAVPYFFSTK